MTDSLPAYKIDRMAQMVKNGEGRLLPDAVLTAKAA